MLAPNRAEEGAPDMTDTTDFPADPARYRVQHERADDGKGPLDALYVVEVAPHSGDRQTLAEYRGDSALDAIIAAARDEERTDPHSDKLPSDRAIICAALREAGIEPCDPSDDDDAAEASERFMHGMAHGCEPVEEAPHYPNEPTTDDEEEADDRDVLERLSEALMVLPPLEVVDTATIQAIRDAHDEIARLREVVDTAIQAWPQFDMDGTDDDCEVNGGDLVEWFGAWRARAKAARGGA